ncbi:MAG: hypothetical protein ACXU81_14820, partial [Myxococcaceae bacterium]
VGAACVKVWARHEGARLERRLDPRGDIYQQRLVRMRAKRRPGETDRQVEERLREQIRTQHLEQLLGVSAIEAEIYRQRLPKMLAERGPEESVQDVEKRLSEELRGRYLGEPMGIGSKEIQIETWAGEFWPHRTDSDRNATFQSLCKEMLNERSIEGNEMGRERLIHYVRSKDPRLTYEEAAQVVSNAGRTNPGIYHHALKLVRQERRADLLMRLAEMNAWETAGRGTEACPQVEALMNRALDTAVATNPRAQERIRFFQTELHFTEDRAREAVRDEFRTEFLLRLWDCPRDARSLKDIAADKVVAAHRGVAERLEAQAKFKTEYLWQLQELRDRADAKARDLPQAPRHPEYRVKQFVRENRLAKVTADVDRLHRVLCPMAGQPAPPGEQIRDAVREASANRSQDEVNQLRALYRERWLKGARGGEPRDLDGEIDARLGNDRELHDQCEGFLNPATAERLARTHAAADRLHAVLFPPAGQPTAEQVRDAVREICAPRSPDELNELRLDYRRRWSKDLDEEVYGKLGKNRRLRVECEDLLHHPEEKPSAGTN